MTLSIQHPAAPGAYLQRNDRAPATVALRTDIAGFVGIAERGPVGVAVAVESMRQFQAVFGGYIGGGFLAYSVRAFFENGGRRARIVRVASDDPAQGAAAGAIGIPVVGGGDPWTVAASSLGAWGNALSVALVERTAGQALIDQSRSLPSYAAVASTSGFAANSLVRLTQAGAPTQVRVLAAIDATQKLLYWLDPDPARRGPRQYPVTGFDSSAPLLAESLTYDLLVYSQGNLATLNQGLSLVPEAQTYAGVLLTPIDYSKFDTPPGALPLVTMLPPSIAPTDVPAPLAIVSDAVLPLAGGRDGVAVLTQDDFIGAPLGSLDTTGATAPRGLAALASACDVAMLAAPDILIRPVEPPIFNPPPATVDPCPLCPPPRRARHSGLARRSRRIAADLSRFRDPRRAIRDDRAVRGARRPRRSARSALGYGVGLERRRRAGAGVARQFRQRVRRPLLPLARRARSAAARADPRRAAVRSCRRPLRRHRHRDRCPQGARQRQSLLGAGRDGPGRPADP